MTETSPNNLKGDNDERSKQIKQAVQDSFQNLIQNAKEHPYKTAGLVVGGTVLLCPGLIVTPLLTGVGFTSSGVASGSVAAGIHSTIGQVAAGSVFATLQGAGTGGAGVVVVNTACQGAIATTGTVSYVVNRYWKGTGEREFKL